jgi:hypothetical protein
MQQRAHRSLATVLALGVSTLLASLPVRCLADPPVAQSSTEDTGDNVSTIQRDIQQQYQAMGQEQQEQAAAANNRSTRTQAQGMQSPDQDDEEQHTEEQSAD